MPSIDPEINKFWCYKNQVLGPFQNFTKLAYFELIWMEFLENILHFFHVWLTKFEHTREGIKAAVLGKYRRISLFSCAWEWKHIKHFIITTLWEDLLVPHSIHWRRRVRGDPVREVNFPWMVWKSDSPQRGSCNWKNALLANCLYPFWTLHPPWWPRTYPSGCPSVAMYA